MVGLSEQANTLTPPPPAATNGFNSTGLVPRTTLFLPSTAPGGGGRGFTSEMCTNIKIVMLAISILFQNTYFSQGLQFRNSAELINLLPY